jgi:hypothetical protein
MTERSPISGRLIFGLAILTMGVLWTLDNLDVIEAGRALRWWGVVPFGWGVMCLLGLGCPRRVMLGSFWALVGAVTLLHAGGVLPVSVFDLWPLVFIFIGANIVFRSWNGTARPWGQNETVESGDTLRTFALMSGNEHKVTSTAFRGGGVDAMMGGATVDLRAARLADNRAVIEVFAMWGGIEIVVPPGWRVQSDVTPIMGGYEDSTMPPTDPDAPLLIVRGFVVMGGIDVQHSSEDRKAIKRGDLPDSGVVVRVRAGVKSRETTGPSPAPAPSPVDPE